MVYGGEQFYEFLADNDIEDIGDDFFKDSEGNEFSVTDLEETFGVEILY